MDTVVSDRRETESRSSGRSEWLAGWSVVGVGLLLAVVSVVGVSFEVADGTHVVAPLTASLGVVAGGYLLRRRQFEPRDVAVVSAWVAATAVVFGAVVMIAALVMADDPLPVGAFIASFMAPIGAAAGGVAGYSDTKRRRQHRLTRRTERALETATDGIAIVDDRGEYVTVNRSLARVYGYEDRDRLAGEHWLSTYPDDEVERLRDEVLPVLAGSGDWRGEATGRRADGSTFPQELTLTRMDDGGTVCIVRDITERRRREQEIRDQKRRLRTIVENAPIVLFAFDEDGELTLSEGRSLEDLGWESGEVVGESVFELYADVPSVIEACRLALDGETVHRTLDLGDVVLESWYSPVFDDSGEVTQVIGTAMDVTDQHERELQIAALHEASRQLTYATTFREVAQTAVDIADEILERSTSTMWRYDDAEGLLQPVVTNEAMASVLEETGVTLEALGDGTFAMECFESGEIHVVEEYRSFGRAAFPELDLGTVVLVPVGDHGLLQVGHGEVEGPDETERSQLEILQMNLEAALDRAEHEDLLRERTEQLETRTSQMEFINSILRHDVLNGMTVIRARGEFLEAELEGRNREHAETVVRWCDDITDFVERVQTVLNALSGDDDVALESVDAAELLREELERVRQTYPEVTVEWSLPERVPVHGDELLGDVLGNVVRNAIEHNETESLRVDVDAEVRDDRVVVSVADDGRGIPPERREEVFRRGESHAKSTGSGFGLFFVDAMVDAYGGHVRVEDNEPGAVFVIELPRPDGHEEPPKRDTP